MVIVCKEHVTKGLNILPAPHVEQIPDKRKECCIFCSGQAIYQMFTLNYSTMSIVPKAEKLLV
ncbi:hypothetical protein R4Z10_09850 [Niallia sp. XMNu-256]|uniref:hypothetical protein n=1 Tax=Niallia sp. XMNu-256 TaxID=3082444 RepID=UPI0030D4D074